MQSMWKPSTSVDACFKCLVWCPCTSSLHFHVAASDRIFPLQLSVVYKFGGSSVANAERMLEVADIVCSFPEHAPLVVLSAMGKVSTPSARFLSVQSFADTFCGGRGLSLISLHLAREMVSRPPWCECRGSCVPEK